MSDTRKPSPATRPPDALLDAYRQAADMDGARPSPRVRAAVLAHAQIVAAQRGDGGRSMPEAMVRRPAANDAAWYWRVAAGVVIGVLGVWVFQSLRPATDAPMVATSQPAPPPTAAEAARTMASGSSANTHASGENAPPVTVADASAPASAGAIARLEPRPAAPSAAVTRGAAGPQGVPMPPSAAYAPAAVGVDRADVAAATGMADAQPTVGVAPKAAPAAPVPQIASAPAAAPLPALASAAVVPAAPPAPTAAPTAPPSQAPQAIPVAAGAVAAAAPVAGTSRGEMEVAMAEASAKRQELRVAKAQAAVERPAADEQRAARDAVRKKDVAKAAVGESTRFDSVVASVARRALAQSNAAMFTAVRARDREGLRRALAEGASPDAVDDSGVSALRLAEQMGDAAIIAILREAGAR